MNAPLTLAAPRALRPLARALTASLALSYRLEEQSTDADVVLVEGIGGWAGAAADLIEGGARRVMVIDPGADDPVQIDRCAGLAGNCGAVVRLSEGFACNPGVPPWQAALDQEFVVFALSGHGDGDLAAMIFAQMRAARAVGIGELTIVDARFVAHGAIVTAYGVRLGTPVTIRLAATSTRAIPVDLVVRAYAPAAMAMAIIPPADSARAARTEITRAVDEVRLPTIFETAHRASLRMLADPAFTGDPLDGFATDVRTLRSLERS